MSTCITKISKTIPNSIWNQLVSKIIYESYNTTIRRTYSIINDVTNTGLNVNPILESIDAFFYDI